jgi:tRNA (cytidine/uridine-2'-O-)-methyltransferase
MDNSKFKIVLVTPDIPGNTGSIGRTCVALGLELILVKPYGFELTEKAVRRAGLDYWKYVNLKEYENWEDFLANEKPDDESLFFYSKLGEKSYYEGNYAKDCYLIFGSETKGLPSEIKEQFPDRYYSLPMYSDKIRSLNLSNVATAVAYECLRHLI